MHNNPYHRATAQVQLNKKYFAAWTMHFQIVVKEGPTKCIF
jgi:hypothetical protein